MVELLASMIEAVGLVIESLAGDIAELFGKKAKGARQTEKGVTR
jgi:hypothetical protein